MDCRSRSILKRKRRGIKPHFPSRDLPLRGLRTVPKYLTAQPFQARAVGGRTPLQCCTSSCRPLEPSTLVFEGTCFLVLGVSIHPPKYLYPPPPHTLGRPPRHPFPPRPSCFWGFVHPLCCVFLPGRVPPGCVFNRPVPPQLGIVDHDHPCNVSANPFVVYG